MDNSGSAETNFKTFFIGNQNSDGDSVPENWIHTNNIFSTINLSRLFDDIKYKQ